MTDFAELPIEVRSVDDTQRVAQMIVCRYGETSVRTPRPERFLPGSFTESVTRRRDRIAFTTEHTGGTGAFKAGTRVARPVAWHVQNPDELQATIKFYDNAEGWDAYQRTRDGEINAGSVGFRAIEERDQGGIREIAKADMHHFALLARDETIPAYDGPRVLEVRQSDRIVALLAITYDPAVADACIDLDDLHKLGAS